VGGWETEQREKGVGVGLASRAEAARAFPGSASAWDERACPEAAMIDVGPVYDEPLFPAATRWLPRRRATGEADWPQLLEVTLLAKE